MSQRYRPWQRPPSEYDTSWATWVTAALNSLFGLTPPPAPTVTAVAKGTGFIYVTWNEVPGAFAYNVWESTTPTLPSGGPAATAIAISGNATNSVLVPSPSGSARYFAVQAVNAEDTVVGAVSAWVKATAT